MVTLIPLRIQNLEAALWQAGGSMNASIAKKLRNRQTHILSLANEEVRDLMGAAKADLHVLMSAIDIYVWHGRLLPVIIFLA